MSDADLCRICGKEFDDEEPTLRTLKPWGLIHPVHVPTVRDLQGGLEVLGERNQDLRKVLESAEAERDARASQLDEERLRSAGLRERLAQVEAELQEAEAGGEAVERYRAWLVEQIGILDEHAGTAFFEPLRKMCQDKAQALTVALEHLDETTGKGTGNE